MKNILFCILFFSLNTLSYGQNYLIFLEKVSLPITGLDKAIYNIEKEDFKLIETHSENIFENTAADMIFFNKDLNSTLIFYHNPDCFSENWCSTVDLYTNYNIYERIKEELNLDDSYKFKKRFISDLGIAEEYIKNDENIYPYSRITLTKLNNNNYEKRFLISYSNNPSYISDLKKVKFRKRYTKYE